MAAEQTQKPQETPGLPGSVLEALAIGVRDAFRPAYVFLQSFRKHLTLSGRALSWLPRRPFRPANYVDAIEYIGFGSLPIIVLVSVFTGGVMGLQFVNAFRQFGMEAIAGGTAGKALALELAPVFTALMLAGRAGAGMATEIGTMRITEQIDALESMAINPIQFLVLPRIVAGVIVTPMLALTFFVIGMAGAYFVAVILMGVDHGQFVNSVESVVYVMDVVQGLIKSAVFGFIVSLVGCYQGYNATGGGRGVGIGTTRAVVVASVSILLSDLLLTAILIEILPAVPTA